MLRVVDRSTWMVQGGNGICAIFFVVETILILYIVKVNLNATTIIILIQVESDG